MHGPMSTTIGRLPDVATPPDLSARIFFAVSTAKIRRVRNELAATIAVFAGFVGIAIASVSFIAEETRSSSFGSYLRLTISDSDVVFSHLNEYVIGIFERLPVGLILSALVAAFLLLGIIGFGQAFIRERRHVGALGFAKRSFA
jgi:hypothetical protein